MGSTPATDGLCWLRDCVKGVPALGSKRAENCYFHQRQVRRIGPTEQANSHSYALATPSSSKVFLPTSSINAPWFFDDDDDEEPKPPPPASPDKGKQRADRSPPPPPPTPAIPPVTPDIPTTPDAPGSPESPPPSTPDQGTPKTQPPAPSKPTRTKRVTKQTQKYVAGTSGLGSAETEGDQKSIERFEKTYCHMVEVYASIALPNEPRTYEDAKSSDDASKWDAALKEEIDSPPHIYKPRSSANLSVRVSHRSPRLACRDHWELRSDPRVLAISLAVSHGP